MKLQKRLGFVALVLVLSNACVSSKVSNTPEPRSPASLENVPVEVRGGDSSSFHPPKHQGAPIVDRERFDVVIMGGGLAGLSAAVYLTDAGKKVLLLEKEKTIGGLAAWSNDGRTNLDRGAAYWTDAYEEELEILKHIGLGDFKKEHPIPEPIDSYFVRGKYYKEIWAEETIAELPASFALFKFELERANAETKIPNQPFEEFASMGGNMQLDRFTTRSWIEGMPAALDSYLNKNSGDAKSAKLRQEGLKILARFNQEKRAGKLQGRTGMEDVIELMDLYCRSALGTTTDTASAMAFANFYISEIEVRYTTPQGTGLAADKMEQILKSRPELFTSFTESPVLKIKNVANGVEVTYNTANQTHMIRADYAIFASQLKIAPDVIEDFTKKSPKQAALMKNLGYSHYSVHLVQVEGQPFRASYDTWTRAADYTENDFTDVILGQWMEPSMLGYEGYRDFQKDPPIKDGVLSIYHPLAPKWLKTKYSDEDAKNLARQATLRMEEIYSVLPSDMWKGPLKVKSIETNRWPLSVHVAAPGHYLERAKIMRQPFGRVFFAHSNLGTPAFEEALFRGHCAADNILKRSVPKFKKERWSNCPID